jgi:hypothetical protein
MAGTMRDPAEQIVLEGPPPGSGRPSWLALLVAAAIALGSGVAIGYGVRGSPNAAPAHGRSLQPPVGDLPARGGSRRAG